MANSSGRSNSNNSRKDKTSDPQQSQGSRVESETIQGNVRNAAQEIGRHVRDAAEQRLEGLRDAAGEYLDAGRERASDYVEQGRDVAHQYIEQGRERAVEIERSLESQIREQPLRAVLAAAGIGFILGIFFMRR